MEPAQGEIEDVDALLFQGRLGEAERVPEAELKLPPVVCRLELAVGVTIGSLVRFLVCRDQGEQFRRDLLIAGHRCGFNARVGGPKGHGAPVLHESPEDLAGDFIDDLQPASLRWTKVQQGVAKREVEELLA